jgi:periplasmic protein CpxP/Spy
MVKRYMHVLIAAGLISTAALFVAAQDTPAPPPDQQSPAQGTGHMRNGPPDPAQRTQELTKKLNLTSDQQTKVQSALESERSQMDSMRQDSSLSQQDRRTKMMDLHKGTDAQIRAILDPTQQTKWDEMQAKRQQWMQNRHQGPPDAGAGAGQQAPPPQQ